jgi:hypothetical protein
MTTEKPFCLLYPDCPNEVFAKKLCKSHYYLEYRRKNANKRIPIDDERDPRAFFPADWPRCSTPKCKSKKHYRRGLCWKCWKEKKASKPCLLSRCKECGRMDAKNRRRGLCTGCYSKKRRGNKALRRLIDKLTPADD